MPGRGLMHSEDWWATKRPAHVLRCSASLKRDGSQCRREVVPGTNVCTQHGGLAPAVQAAAATRIQMSVDDAVKRLHSMLDDPAVEARDKVKILHDLLDRGGLGATSKHLVGVVTDDPVEKLFRELAADPNATYDPNTVQVQAVPSVESAGLADRDLTWDELFGGRDSTEPDDDVVDAELVPEPSHTVDGGTSGKTPKRIRKSIERELRRIL